MWRAGSTVNRNIQQTSIRLLSHFLQFLKRVWLQVKITLIILLLLLSTSPCAELVNYGTSAFVITDARMEIVAPFYHGLPDNPKGKGGL